MPATEDYLRNIKTMHKVFCLSAVVLLVCTLWMMWADYADEWRLYQREALRLVAERDRKRIAEIEADPEFKASLAQLDEEKQAADATLATHEARLKELEAAAREASIQASFHMRGLRTERAKRDVARANFGLGVRDNLPADQLAALRQAFEQQEALVAEQEAVYKQLDLNAVLAKSQVDDLTADRDKLAKQLSDLESEISRRRKAIDKIEPSNWFSAMKRDLMLLPIINGFNSPERIHQDWMPKLKIDLGGMSKVDRFDRCRTCHISIDSVGGGTDPAFPLGTKDGEFRNPYASHPRLDLYLTSTSPHPLPKFGCTVCHEGQGSGTSFTNASHTPNDPHQAEVWAKSPKKSQAAIGDNPDAHHHGWFDNHFWEHPMLPDRFEQSSCIRCHINVVELGHHPKFGATAPKVHRGYELVKTYGCFGCHEINGYEGTRPIGPDLRLEPNTPEELAKALADPLTVPGKMRKVGPSLRHIGLKSPEGWVATWTDEPKKFRPTTRMPQFFHLTNQQDPTAERFNPVEVAAVAHYLKDKSQPLELLSPKEDYQPDAARGQQLFATRGCAACHQHEGVKPVPGETSTFGPELSKINAKLLPGAQGFNWLYTWLRDPQRYHPRSKMPNLYLEAEEVNKETIDPAADIAAFLLKLQGQPADFQPAATYDPPPVDPQALDDLTVEFLKKNLTNQQITEVMDKGQYPIPSGGLEAIKGDEIELVKPDGSPITDPEEMRRRKLNYVGRRTISRYGCYGCHDIPNFEDGRPIGTALQDWGKKDRSRLAFEHIQEYAHHRGQPELGVEYDNVTPAVAARLKLEPPSGVRVTQRERGVTTYRGVNLGETGHPPAELQIDDVIVGYNSQPIIDVAQLRDQLNRTEPGALVEVRVIRGGEELVLGLRPDGSLHDRAVNAVKTAERHEFATHEDEERELSTAFFYESLVHHGRPGFLWQKLRQPRSYDFEMVDVKPYDDRLRMPKFPFSETDIEDIATFVLGLLAEPPSDEYLFNPDGPKGDWIKGEYLLDQYNCTSCHMLDLPEIRYGHDPANENEIASLDLSAEIPAAVELLKQLKPPANADTGRKMTVQTEDGPKELPVISFHGMVIAAPDPDDDPEDQEYVAESWNTVELDGKLLTPTSRFIFPAARLEGGRIKPGRGGAYAEWLAPQLVESRVAKDLNDARQSSPPPLYLEGIKVQTPWLFNFLQNPDRLRHRTVLRMPRFNMSADEARTLANYFAAADGASYPYQKVPEREPEYLVPREREYVEKFPGKEHDYLSESWKLLNGPVCIQCHYVGGRSIKAAKPEDSIRGPNLDQAGNRLRPDWMMLWLYRPTWITPYTSMPQNFPPSKVQFEDVFGGDANWQTIGLRDALVNYLRLMERDGRVIYDAPLPATTTAAETPSDSPDSAETK
jgi:cbb3-type cytochrome oxidase cytochrome c subunit